jgi:hypothetical protein
MTTMVLCDLCPNDISLVPAEYRVEFHRIGGPKMPDGDTSSDKPVDLCQRHYDKVWECLHA